MTDESHERTGAKEGFELAVLAAMRGMAAIALSAREPGKDDHDLIDHLVDGLLAMPSVARVRRVRMRAAEQELYQPSSAGGAVPSRQEGDAATAAAMEAVPRRSPDGRVLVLTISLLARNGEVDVFGIEADPAGGGLSAAECVAATALRDQAAMAIALRASRAQARLDPLTGCLNHGAMLTQLEDEIARAERHCGGFACVILDLDDFKSVNDRFGHAAGNAVLRAVAAAMQGACRTYDVCCRYGGDEFVVILPDASGEEALHGAERVRSAVERTLVEHHGGEIGVGATAGVAEWRPDESSAALLARVDRALLEAKASGKGTTGRA